MRSVPRLTATVSVTRDTEGTDATGQSRREYLIVATAYLVVAEFKIFKSDT